jgi:hypothetical protein
MGGFYIACLIFALVSCRMARWQPVWPMTRAVTDCAARGFPANRKTPS